MAVLARKRFFGLRLRMTGVGACGGFSDMATKSRNAKNISINCEKAPIFHYKIIYNSYIDSVKTTNNGGLSWKKQFFGSG